MKNHNITLRAAQPADAQLLATVITLAIGGDPKTFELYPVFLELAGRKSSQYSYCNAIIAEVEGVAAGAIVGYDGARLHELRAPIYDLILQHTGRHIEIEEETCAGEFYLDSVAVLPPYRRMGIGRMLLEAMRDRAFNMGHDHVGLLVDVDNPQAEALYLSLGFRRVNPTTFLGHPMWHMQAHKTV